MYAACQRLLLTFFCISLLIGLSPLLVTAQFCPANGDVNGDTRLTPVDVLLTLQHFLGRARLSADVCQPARANVVGPASDITPVDALCIFRLFLGLPACTFGDGLPIVSQPPAPPADTRLPDELTVVLERVGDGRPIVFKTASSTVPGLTLALVYDDTFDDPIARWSHCLSRVAACYRSNGANPISDCVEQIERCDSPEGGRQCCPEACIEAFRQRRADGLAEFAAVEASFGRGDCVAGMPPPPDDGGIQP